LISSSQHTPKPVLKDRAAGALVGLATGDALGAPYEFHTPGPASAEMKSSPIWEKGEWTDDTDMAICIAEELATGEFDPHRIGDRFLDWFNHGPKDVGILTRAVLRGARSGAELAQRAKGYFEDNPKGAAGNGSLMRTSPVALAFAGDDDALTSGATSVSDLTHADPLAAQACVLWCIAIDRAISDGRLDGAREGLDLLAADERKQWAQWLDEAESEPPASFTGNGFVVRALQAAHASIHQTPIPEDAEPCEHLQAALQTAVSIGDDTDTVAAIAGSLLGARWGASAIPLEWKRWLHGWPGYRARDLMRLAVLTYSKGRADNVGWPEAKTLMPYYKKQWPHDATVVPLPNSEQVAMGNVGALELPEVARYDVVLSLCRIGTEDGPSDKELHEVWLMDEADPGENPNLSFLLRDIAAFIEARRAEGKKVFFHCVRAESRTPTIAAAYVAQRDTISASEAMDQIQETWPSARINPGFAEALRQVWPDSSD
jgi:ADP-ribosyl-[dinitrogen reductase] hydrolase